MIAWGLRLRGGVEEEGLKHRGIFRVANFDPVIVDVRLHKFLKTQNLLYKSVDLNICKAKKKIRRLRDHKM